MIFITGDCHSDFRRFSTQCFPEQKEMTRDDYVIICGDFGGIWETEKSDYESYWLDWLEEKPFTTLFVCGNHENFDRLLTMEEMEWNGGKVHKVRPHVLHLMRGYVFDMNGCSFFTFGGARSHDIQGGILDPQDKYFQQKKAELNKGTLPYRINHISWWKEEMPNDAEKNRGLMNLHQRNNKVDFIVSHDCPSSTLALFSQGLFKMDSLNAYLEEIRATTEYKKWFFGHYHDNRNVTEKDIMLYEQIIQIQ